MSYLQRLAEAVREHPWMAGVLTLVFLLSGWLAALAYEWLLAV